MNSQRNNTAGAADAVKIAELAAERSEAGDDLALDRILAGSGYNRVGLCRSIFANCAVTVNFHPDRLSGNGRSIIDNLLTDGEYKNQYESSTTNGGRTAYPGGERDLWEKRLFQEFYHTEKRSVADRPKYGALNIMNYRDGASPRFGSCFFALKPEVLRRCTFAFGDSSSHPEAMGTLEHFRGVLNAMFTEIAQIGRFLNREQVTVAEAAHFLTGLTPELTALGHDLDYYIETHVHGRLKLVSDVAAFYLDESFVATDVWRKALDLGARYGFAVLPIPERRIRIAAIDDAFRGPMMRLLAEKIDERFGGSGGLMNARLIGLGSCDSIRNPAAWSGLGTEPELFQYFKQLWHTVAYHPPVPV